MTILKAMTMISQDLHKVLERRKKGKYRSEKNRKAVIIADMKDILRNYESEMDTDVEKAMIYGINLAIYNRLTDLIYDDFETYIKSLCALLNAFCNSVDTNEEEPLRNREEHTGELVSIKEKNTEYPDITDNIYNSTISTSANGSRKISSGMIPYRG